TGSSPATGAGRGPRTPIRPIATLYAAGCCSRCGHSLRGLAQDLLVLDGERCQRVLRRLLPVERFAELLRRGRDQLVVDGHIPEVLDDVHGLREGGVVRARRLERVALEDGCVRGEAAWLLHPFLLGRLLEEPGDELLGQLLLGRGRLRRDRESLPAQAGVTAGAV